MDAFGRKGDDKSHKRTLYSCLKHKSKSKFVQECLEGMGLHYPACNNIQMLRVLYTLDIFKFTIIMSLQNQLIWDVSFSM